MTSTVLMTACVYYVFINKRISRILCTNKRVCILSYRILL